VITTRLANLGDLTRMVMFGRNAHGRSNYSDVPFNAAVARDTLRGSVMLKGQDVIIAEREDGSLCGLLIALTIQLPFSRRKYATDGIFVAEQGGDKLLDAFLEWAKSKHVARVDMSQSQFDSDDRCVALYTSRGLERTGGMYLKKFPLEVAP
jgi:hypothetical protein